MIINILADRNNFLSEISEERNLWIDSLLKNHGFTSGKESDLELAKSLNENKIAIIHNASLDEYNIYKEAKLIGKWGAPKFNLKRDKETNQLYYLIEIKVQQFG